MKNSDINIKDCDNCRFYAQHYAFFEGRFRSVFCGHCTCRQIPCRTNRKFVKAKDCEFWEQREILIEERNEEIGEILTEMAQNIKEIAQILKLE